LKTDESPVKGDTTKLVDTRIKSLEMDLAAWKVGHAELKEKHTEDTEKLKKNHTEATEKL
jgi:hypothetical protein